MKKPAIKKNKNRYHFIWILILTVSLVVLYLLSGIAIRNFPKRAQLSAFDATKTSYELPVMLILYTPDTNSDGKVDSETGYGGYYNQFTKKSYSDSISDLRLKLMDEAYDGAKYLTQATKYHGYKDPTSKPSITYNIRRNYIYESTENPPISTKVDVKSGKNLLDYKSILSKFETCKIVDQSGVRDIWIFAPETDKVFLTSSNLSSKVVGDVSNSDRDPNDLPLCNNPYTVYTFDIKSGVEEILYKKARQIETVLSEWPKTDKLTPEILEGSLFWGKFVGADINGKIINPGCGSATRAPNSTSDFDYFNETKVNSTCENFEADIKTTYSQISCNAWSRYFYGENDCKVDGGISYLIWWMQNIPGQNNYILFQGRKLRNWWDYIGNIDRVFSFNSFYVLNFDEPNQNIPKFDGNFDEKPVDPLDDDEHLYSHPLLIKPTKSTIEFPLDVKWGEVESSYNYWVKLDLRGDGKDDIYYKKFSPNTSSVTIKEKDLSDREDLYDGSIIDISIYSKSAKYGDRRAGPVPFRLVSKRKRPTPSPVVIANPITPTPRPTGVIASTPIPTIVTTPYPTVVQTGTSIPVTWATPVSVVSPSESIEENGASTEPENIDDNSSSPAYNIFLDIWDFIYGILEFIFYHVPVAAIKYVYSFFNK